MRSTYINICTDARNVGEEAWVPVIRLLERPNSVTNTNLYFSMSKKVEHRSPNKHSFLLQSEVVV